MPKECGIHSCKRFGQRPALGLRLHNAVFHSASRVWLKNLRFNVAYRLGGFRSASR